MNAANIFRYPIIADMKRFRAQVKAQESAADDGTNANLDKLVKSDPEEQMSVNDLFRKATPEVSKETVSIRTLSNGQQVGAWAEFGMKEPGRLDLSLAEIQKVNNHKTDTDDFTLVSSASRLARMAEQRASELSPERARGHKLGTLLVLHHLSGETVELGDLSKCAASALKTYRAYPDREEADEFVETVAKASSHGFFKSRNYSLWSSLPFSADSSEPLRLLMEIAAAAPDEKKETGKIKLARAEQADSLLTPASVDAESLKDRAPTVLKISTPSRWEKFTGQAPKPVLPIARKYAENFFTTGEDARLRTQIVKKDDCSDTWDGVLQAIEKEAGKEKGARGQIAKAVYSAERPQGWEGVPDFFHNVIDEAGFKVVWKADNLTAYQPPHALDTEPAVILEEANYESVKEQMTSEKTHRNIIDNRSTSRVDRLHFVPSSSQALRRDFDLFNGSVLSVAHQHFWNNSLNYEHPEIDGVGGQEKKKENVKIKALLEHALWSTWEASSKQPVME